MKSYVGTVRRNDLEGGFFELVTEDGQTLRLQGGVFEDGQRVRVEGSIERGGFGFQMSGPSLVVHAVHPA
jgi:hypothetical protein